jgi:hypothetical protein
MEFCSGVPQNFSWISHTGAGGGGVMKKIIAEKVLIRTDYLQCIRVV